MNRLTEIAHRFEVDLQGPFLKERFANLILSLNRKTDMPVVVLVDEYDKPIIDHLGKGEPGLRIARANRDILKSFLGTLKGGEVSAVLRFVFVTGVARFSRVSLFSELNNLDDISMSRWYADMLGYTEAEIGRLRRFNRVVRERMTPPPLNAPPPAPVADRSHPPCRGDRFR
jgi:hypothetical protein